MRRKRRSTSVGATRWYASASVIFVARGTVEDRVEALKDRKRTLADALLGDAPGEASALAGITAEDVAALLADADPSGDDEGDAVSA